MTLFQIIPYVSALFILMMTVFASKLQLILLMFLFVFIKIYYKNIPNILKMHGFFIFLLCLYPIWNIFELFFRFDIPSEMNTTRASRYPMWLWGILAGVLIVGYLSTYKSWVQVVKVWAPSIVCLTVMLGLLEYLITNDCRAGLFNPTIFTAPLFATTITLLYISIIIRDSKYNGWLIGLMVAATLFLSTALTGARGILVGQLVAYGLIILFLGCQKPYRNLSGIIFLAVLGGLGIGFLVDYLSLCTFTIRSQAMFNMPETIIGASKAITSADSSISIRLEMWRNAVQAILEAPLNGFGAYYEPQLVRHIGADHFHVHNMYLSWLVWGGLLTLMTGILFLSSAALCYLGRLTEPSVFISCIGVLSLWAAAMIFDSFMTRGHFYYMYIISTAMVYFLHAEKLKHDEHIQSPSR